MLRAPATTACSPSCSGHDLRLALDLRTSWTDADIAPAVRVNDHDAGGPFQYLRFREPPYSEQQLGGIAATIEPLLAAGLEVYAYFQHEDAPTAPTYAARLLERVRADDR